MSHPVVDLGLRLVVLAGIGGALLAVREAVARRAGRRRRQALRASAPEVTSGQPTVLLFSGTLCADCIQQKEILAELRGRLGGWQLREVQAASEVGLARRFGVESVPATVVLDAGGHAVAVNYRLADAWQLSRQVEPVLPSAPARRFAG